MRLPFRGLYIFTQDFGANPADYAKFGLAGHDGLDFGCPTRTEIIAPHAGTVIEAQFDEPGYGWYVKLESESEGSVIAHLEQIDVQVGFKLNEGDHIGWSDNTGNSTGPHCHWGYYKLPRDRSNGFAGFIDQKLELAESGIHLVLGQLPTLDTDSQALNTADSNTYKGLDLTNQDSVKAAIDAWYDVANGKYKTADDYQVLEQQLAEVKKQLLDTQAASSSVSSDLKNYHEMQAVGYNSVDDITKALATKDTTNLALQTENAQVRGRNGVLAGEIQKMETENNTAAEMGQKFLEENSTYTDAFRKLVSIIEVEKPSWSKVFDKVLYYKDMSDRFIAHLDSEQPKNPVAQATQIISQKMQSTDFIMQLFNLIPKKKEVS